jgi:hypothetical protein
MAQRFPLLGEAGDSKESAADTAITITYAAKVGYRHVIDQIIASYSETPSGGGITIQDGAGNTIFQIHINDDALHKEEFWPPLMGSENTAMIVTMTAGGGTAVGRLNVRHRVY